MDRDELDDRMRLRRPGDAPFRRGVGVGEPRGDDPYAAGDYEPFRPEPEDVLARRPSAPNTPAPRVDHTPADLDAQPVEPAPYEAPAEPAPQEPAPPAPPAEEPLRKKPVAAFLPPPAEPVFGAPAWPQEPRYQPEEPPYYSGPFDGGYPASAYVEEPGGGGFGPLAVVAVVALGLMAIGLGAILSGVFSGVASASPSPSPLPSVAATASPTLEPTVAPTATQTATSTPTVGPVVGADGFTAETQPCAEKPDSFSGCDSSGSTVTGDSMWVWVGFRKGNDADLITATVLDATGGKVDDDSVSLSGICGGGSSCNGWLYFGFTGLTPGNYGIRIDRNGQLAAESRFTVSG